jgi:hypothetical protein
MGSLQKPMEDNRDYLPESTMVSSVLSLEPPWVVALALLSPSFPPCPVMLLTNRIWKSGSTASTETILEN